jgi:catechol 2,3-dioxygenase-like lactoylglutathione lyase family enzyme
LQIKNSNVTVIVSDMEKAIKFYTEALGLELVLRSQTGFDFAVVKAPGITIGLNPIQHGLHPGSCESLSIGFEVENLDNTMSELHSKGIEFNSEIIVEGPVKIARFTDLDKNPLYILSVENK